MHAVAAARKASTFIYCPLCVPEIWSHDANVTVATVIAG